MGKAKSVKAIQFFDLRDHGSSYTQSYVQIYTGELQSIDKPIVECIDNKAGYGNLETAMEIQRELIAAKERGVTQVFDWGWQRERLCVRYQHYYGVDGSRDGYCSPRVDIGDDPREIRQNWPEFNRLSTGGFPQTPDELIARYPRAVRIEHGKRYLGYLVLPAAEVAESAAAE